jgi:uncharacterized Zn finger protein
VPHYADDLAVARLNVLERQGRFQEYLYLAEAEGLTDRYVTMLVRLGRVPEAVTYGLQHLDTPDEALALAKALRERGELDAALRVAWHGLSLQGRKALLASWLCDLASGMGETARALEAAKIACCEEPSLTTYLRVPELAGERWPEHCAELLEHLRRVRTYAPQGPVEVFLHEGLIADAIAAVEDTWQDALIEQVAAAAIATHPEWVIQTCRRKAEVIMDQGQAQRYDDAARWLAKARAAYRGTERDAEWGAYLEEVIARHRRKYKLLPLLQALRD